MGHNSRYKPGPTLEECEAMGVTHIEVQCLKAECRHLARPELKQLADLPRKVPINHIDWKCPAIVDPATRRRCRNINVSVAIVIPGQPVTPLPIFDTKGIRPEIRRTPCAHRRKVLARS